MRQGHLVSPLRGRQTIFEESIKRCQVVGGCGAPWWDITSRIVTEVLGLPFPELNRPTSHGANADASSDPAVHEVCAWFRAQRKMEERFANVFRQSIDEVLDGQRTGRFDIYADTVAKTERTYLGTKVEIVCQDEFQLERGRKMDYVVAGHEVDAKFSMSSLFGQQIPREALGHICLLMYANDQKGQFSVALVRATDDILNKGANQDGKKTISREGRSKVHWLVRDGRLPENQLLRLPASVLEAIFDRGLSKQERVNELFRRVQGDIVYRRTLITVAQQHDGPKRARDARLTVCDDGILILGYRAAHREIARDLGIAVPRQSEWVSVRVVPRSPSDPRPAALIGGVQCVVAQQEEPNHPVPAQYGIGE